MLKGRIRNNSNGRFPTHLCPNESNRLALEPRAEQGRDEVKVDGRQGLFSRANAVHSRHETRQQCHAWRWQESRGDMGDAYKGPTSNPRGRCRLLVRAHLSGVRGGMPGDPGPKDGLLSKLWLWAHDADVADVLGEVVRGGAQDGNGQ